MSFAGFSFGLSTFSYRFARAHYLLWELNFVTHVNKFFLAYLSFFFAYAYLLYSCFNFYVAKIHQSLTLWDLDQYPLLQGI